MKTTRGVAWIDPGQAAFVRGVFARSGIDLVGVGCPEGHQAGKAAAEIGCESVDDLRSVLTGGDVDLVLIADPGAFGDTEIGQDLEVLRVAHARDVVVATLEPIPASAAEVVGTDWVEAIQSGVLNAMVRFLPRTRLSSMMVELQTAMETFGVIRSCSVSMVAPRVHGSLGARLFDGMDLVRALMGVPEVIEASYVSPSSGRGLHPLPGQSLRGLHGECTMNLRYPDGRAAAMMFSDQAGVASTTLVAMGAEGHLVVNDHGFCWRSPDGELVDSFTRSEDEADEVSRQLVELCSGVGATQAPIEYASVLSMTHATLLSSRTGQGESPETTKRLLLEV